MPIYEYRCDACGHEFDELQKLADAPLIDCPSCAKPTLIKKVSAAGFQLKGTGWYATDFKGKKPEKKGEPAGDAKPDAKSDAKPEAKAEAKPDAKPDAKPAPKAESIPKTAPAKKPDAA